jgi:hypothetical protein
MRSETRPADAPVTASETWTLAFASPDASGAVVRLTRWADHAWYWAYLVSSSLGLVVVRDHELAPPRPRGPLLVRGDGLWAELVEETPDEHWNVGLEAFGVRLADPLDAERGERGDRLPVGLDVEWETGRGEFGRVDGELAVGPARRVVASTGRFEHRTGDEPWSAPSRRVFWQRDATDGHTARDDAVHLELDRAGLPTRVEVGSVRLEVAAAAIVPVPRRFVLALVGGDAGWGWLEWCPERDLADPGSAARPAPPLPGAGS